MVKIAIDAMGGDFAPREQVLGAVTALNKDKDLSVILCGDEPQIKAVLSECKYDANRVEIVHTTEVITMEDSPAMAVKTKKDSSTVVAFRLVKEGRADGVVSSGSTGAVLTAGVLILRRIKGVSRPGLCPIIPNHNGGGTFICDCGAKATVNARIDSNGRIVTQGEQVLLGGNDSYIAMCHRCWERGIRENRIITLHK